MNYRVFFAFGVAFAAFFWAVASPTPAVESDEKTELTTGFATPPVGFGEVPFWWWTGEKLDVDRLLWQVDELARKGVSGVQVNYAHQDIRNEIQPNWLTYPNDPEVLSDEWFDVFERVAARCREKKMGIGLSGYTLDWQNSPTNLFDRIIYRDKETQSRTLYVAAKKRLRVGEKLTFQSFEADVRDANEDDAIVRIVEYPLDVDGRLDAPNAVELASDAESLKLLDRTAPTDAEIWVFKARRVPHTLNPLAPDAGKKVVERFFQPFEDRAKALAAKTAPSNAEPIAENASFGLNYFFQDELQLGTGDLVWADDVADEFAARKGYSYWTAIPAMFGVDVGPNAEKYRLDYMDVRVRLAEERYFQPIFNWHSSRGMIYACDSGGRGKDPSEFGDYFSAVRWYTAPGHDVPGGNADFIKNKVSSSIAHFYGRSRVWLEGYHSFGWGATPERLFFATNENYLFGANLLNLHGLYYTTYGGFWEWAPPCYHFRQPYWETFDVFLKYFERLSFILTRGVEQADFVVLYPVSSFQSGLGGPRARDVAFESASKIFASGRDVLFIDDDSLKNAEIRDGKLVVAGSEHRVLVLPATQGIRWSTLSKAREFYRAGGVVVALDSLPIASDRAGRDDAELTAAVREIFATTADEVANGRAESIARNENGGVGAFFSTRLQSSESVENSEKTASNVEENAVANATVSKIREYPGGFTGRWAWSAEPRKNVFFKWIAVGLSDEPTEYAARFFCDNVGALYVGDRKICANVDYQNGWSGTLTLKNGDVVTIDGVDEDAPRRGSAGLFFALVRDGKTLVSTENFCVLKSASAVAASWRTEADSDAFAELAPVDVANVHVLHRTGVNSEAVKSVQVVQTTQNAQGSDVELWRRFDAFLQDFPRDVFDEKNDKVCGVMRRSTQDAEIFYLMGAEKDAWLTFRAQGKVEFWNAWDGSRREIVELFQPNADLSLDSNVAANVAGTTTLRWPFSEKEAGLVVFWKNERPTRELTALETNVDEIVELGPDADGVWAARAFAAERRTPEISENSTEIAAPKPFFVRATSPDGTTRTLRGAAPNSSSPLRLDGDWTFELAPTLDNRFGDFRLPISETRIGAEAQRFDCVASFPNNETQSSDSQSPAERELPNFDGVDATNVLNDFGQKFWKIGPFPNDVDVAALDARFAALRTIEPDIPIVVDGREFRWEPYSFSWRWGIEGNPGRQGYHGLKEKIDSRFIGLGKNQSALNETIFGPEKDGSIYYLWSTVAVENANSTAVSSKPNAIPVDVCVGGDAPNALFVDGRRFDFDSVDENALILTENGAKTPVLLRYDAAGRRACCFVARRPDESKTVKTRLIIENGADFGASSDERADRLAAATGERTPLSTVWFNRLGVLDFDVWGTSTRPTYWFSFVAPPGLRQAIVSVRGAIRSIVVDGRTATGAAFGRDVSGNDYWSGNRTGVQTDLAKTTENGGLERDVFAAFSDRTIRCETINFVESFVENSLEKPNEEPNEISFERASTVLIEVAPEPGSCGGAVFPEPIRLICGEGRAPLGDWNKLGVLANYSGGVRYRKTFDWEDEIAPNVDRITLDLGGVGASCRVFLNGREVGALPTPPWTLEIGDYLKKGENVLEVLVVNTLANFYSNIPSNYKSAVPSGLFGPVEIRRERSFELREDAAPTPID